MLVTGGRGAAYGSAFSGNTRSADEGIEVGPCLMVDGPPTQAGLGGFDPVGEIRLLIRQGDAPESRTLTKSIDDFICWGTCPDLRPGENYLYFLDGTLLSGNWQGWENGLLRWRHARIGDLQVPTEQLAGLVVAAPSSTLARDRLLDRIAAGSSEYDRLILTNGDELRGRVLHGDTSAVRMLSDFGAVDVSTSRVAAVGFRGSGVPPTVAGSVTLGLEDGSRLIVRGPANGRYPLVIELQTGKDSGTSPIHQLRLAERAAEPETWEFSAAVKYLHAFGGRVDYLSDRTPAEYLHVPYLTYAQPLGRDRTPRGAYLRSGGTLYLKGLGTYSACRATYALAKQFQGFCAEVVMDDAARGRGDAACRAVVDGSTVWRTDSLRSAIAPAAVNLDVSNAERLDLIVEFGPRADELDYVDWLNARLIR
ncbi:MAG: hypothetical protein GYA33_13180 [Thermogutta sp.]|nr:hypothetical protein [Thermogutta sp.]